MEWLLLAAGIAKGAASLWNRHVTDSQTRKSLKTQKTNLESSITRNNDLYAIKKDNADKATAREITVLEQSITNIESNRDTAFSTSKKTIADNGAIAAAQIAEIQIQGAQAEGQGAQQAATSGFRATGSAMNAKMNAGSSYARSKALAVAQANLQTYSDYSKALESYTSATQQADAYRLQIAQAEEALKDNLELLDEELKKKNAVINEDIADIKSQQKYMDSGEYWTSQILGATADIFGIASDTYTATGGSDNKKYKEKEDK